MRFFHPTNEAEFSARNRLLQDSMRPGSPLFPIETEYPIVLSPEFADFSICCEESGTMVAHANLWPRRAITAEGKTIATLALVGNVATHKDFRGRGFMKSLIHEIVSRAAAQGLDALILWSDLSEFYQKMGFVALGEEFRWHIQHPPSHSNGPKPHKFHFTAAHEASPALINRCIDLRYHQFPTLERTADENLMIHKIPAMFLITITDSDENLVAYGLMGKGYDMAGVVHEWGVINPEWLGTLLSEIRAFVGVPEILFLTPSNLEPSFKEHLDSLKLSYSSHSMCLVKQIAPKHNESLNDLFIWGPDSI